LFFCKKKFKSLFDLAFCEIAVRFRRSGHDGLQANGLATACMSGGKTWQTADDLAPPWLLIWQ
jgi:hypothetical protein